MKPSETLRKAARRVERALNNCGCDAIGMVASRGQNCTAPEEVMHWFRFVSPNRVEKYEAWWGRVHNLTHSTPRNIDARIIGLCLAAAIAESEGQ